MKTKSLLNLQPEQLLGKHLSKFGAVFTVLKFNQEQVLLTKANTSDMGAWWTIEELDERNFKLIVE